MGDMASALEDYERADELLGAKVCMVCMEERRSSRLHPCMHAALCMDCAQALRERGKPCPICGKGIETVEAGEFMRTFAAETLGTAAQDPVGPRTPAARMRAQLTAAALEAGSPAESEGVWASPTSSTQVEPTPTPRVTGASSSTATNAAGAGADAVRRNLTYLEPIPQEPSGWDMSAEDRGRSATAEGTTPESSPAAPPTMVEVQSPSGEEEIDDLLDSAVEDAVAVEGGSLRNP